MGVKTNQYQFEFEELDGLEDLTTDDAFLLSHARKTTALAYAPYSNFKVGAYAQLASGSYIAGSNQENASYPVGVCAERALLASVGQLFPNEPIITMAISYHNLNSNTSNRPLSPCGMCRQALQEYEARVNQPIRLILSGLEGKVYIISKSSMLLPLSFNGDDLK